MVNGYVNIPSELSDLDKFAEPRKIPGIYNKMKSVLDLKKPAVGVFTYMTVTAVFTPAVYVTGGKIALNFKLGAIDVAITINEFDTVKIE